MFMFTVMISTPLPPLTNRSRRGGDQSGSLPPRGYVKLLNQHSMLKIVRISKIRVMRTPADYLDKVLLGLQPAHTARENKQWALNGSNGRNHLPSVSTLLFEMVRMHTCSRCGCEKAVRNRKVQSLFPPVWNRPDWTLDTHSEDEHMQKWRG